MLENVKNENNKFINDQKKLNAVIKLGNDKLLAEHNLAKELFLELDASQFEVLYFF